MQYHVKEGPGRAGVALSGRLTFSDAPQFAKVLDLIVSRGLGGCDIDLAGLDFIDSTGMSLFVYVYDAAKADALDITLANVKGTVRDALCRAGFDTLFPLG